jgi:hypothetical protein
MSGSESGMSKDPTEERFPLLLQLLEEERLPKLEPGKEISRYKRVNVGVAMLLGRWPGYITAGCIFAAVLSIVTVLTIIMITTVLINTMLDSNMAHELVTSKESALPGIETPCDYQQEQKVPNKSRTASRYNTLNLTGVQSPSSLEGTRENISVMDTPISPHHTVFFVKTDGILSPQHLCAVESAAKVMSNYKFYLIILSTNNTKTNIKSNKRFNELLNSNPNIKLFNLKDDKYFHDSPIRGILHKSNFSPSLIAFAARILTLWRYGGITYDLDLVTLDNNASRGTYPIPSDDDVMISRDSGAVMSVRLQCHAFLYHMMMSLTSLYANQYESCDMPVSSNNVIHHALKNFCYNASKKFESTTVSQEEPYKICKGISALPDSMICRKTEERMSANSNCVWASSNGRNLHFREHLCPVSYRQYTSKEISKIKRITSHKIRHKHPD